MLRELNQVMDYIEEHLTEDLSLEMISEYVGVSDYHFRKIFFYLSGMTLNEYIKNRKLSEGNKELLQGETVTDVAFKYGYQSVDGFTRAFKKWSGFLPSGVGKSGVSRSFSTLSWTIAAQGGVTMEFRIEKKPAFNLVGASSRVAMQFERVRKEIVKLGQSITPQQRGDRR